MVDRIQPLSMPVGAIFYYEYKYNKAIDTRMEKLLREAGVKIWKEGK